MNGYERVGELETENDPAARIVVAIWRDVTDRRGLRQQLDQVDDEIQIEIVNAWLVLVRAELVKSAGQEGKDG